MLVQSTIFWYMRAIWQPSPEHSRVFRKRASPDIRLFRERPNEFGGDVEEENGSNEGQRQDEDNEGVTACSS